jgi:DNA-binding response OmpR family regulator
LVLDVMLPVISGLELCRRLKACRPETPVLMLSALGTIQDKVQGLETGADDYLTKPFHFDELLARLRALNRRNNPPVTGTVYQVADLEMDCQKRMVTRNGQEIKLTLKEFTMLETFLMNRNRVLTRMEIAEAVWGLNFNNRTNLIDVYVNYVRSKVDKGFSLQLIHTVVGVGYVLKG